MLNIATKAAVDAVLSQVDESARSQVEQGLAVCFSTPSMPSLDGATSVRDGLRGAVAAQIGILCNMVANERNGLQFFEQVSVDETYSEQHT